MITHGEQDFCSACLYAIPAYKAQRQVSVYIVIVQGQMLPRFTSDRHRLDYAKVLQGNLSMAHLS